MNDSELKLLNGFINREILTGVDGGLRRAVKSLMEESDGLKSMILRLNKHVFPGEIDSIDSAKMVVEELASIKRALSAHDRSFIRVFCENEALLNSISALKEELAYAENSSSNADLENDTLAVENDNLKKDLLELTDELAAAKDKADSWDEALKWKPYLHFCMTAWDGLLIDRDDDEFEACLCFKDKPPSLFPKLHNKISELENLAEIYRAKLLIADKALKLIKTPQNHEDYQFLASERRRIAQEAYEKIRVEEPK